jgi:hypothetical protein
LKFCLTKYLVHFNIKCSAQMNQEVYLHFERMLIKEITHPYSVTQHNASQLIKIKLSMQQLYFHGVTGEFTRLHTYRIACWYILRGTFENSLKFHSNAIWSYSPMFAVITLTAYIKVSLRSKYSSW